MVHVSVRRDRSDWVASYHKTQRDVLASVMPLLVEDYCWQRQTRGLSDAAALREVARGAREFCEQLRVLLEEALVREVRRGDPYCCGDEYGFNEPPCPECLARLGEA